VTVIVVPDKIRFTNSEVKADALVSIGNPEEVCGWARSGVLSASTVSYVEPLVAVTGRHNTVWACVENSKLRISRKMCFNLCKVGYDCFVSSTILLICCFNGIAEGSQQR
jgi:hypothetical protein